MAWLWSSWEEYVSHVDPQWVQNRGVYRLTLRESAFEVQQRFFKAVGRIEFILGQLDELGFNGRDDVDGTSVNSDVYRRVEELLYAGEELLLVHKRLGVSMAAYHFACCNDIIEKWDRNLGTPRAAEEVNELIRAVRELMNAFDAISREDTDLLVRKLELPAELESDFYLARNLFSVGFDDIGVLIAGRGLEGVLRAIARRRKLSIVLKGPAEPVAEADLHDLIEALYRVRWQASGRRLISQQTRNLLQYLRSVRNSHAHGAGEATLAESNPRETAVILAATANRLWAEVTGTKSRLSPTTITKSW